MSREQIKDYPWSKMLLQGEFWMDRYGRLIKIRRMSSRYIRNALRYAERASWMEAIRVASYRTNGEMAQMAQEEIMDDYLEGRVPLIEAMVYEQERRKLRPRLVEAVLDRFRK